LRLRELAVAVTSLNVELKRVEERMLTAEARVKELEAENERLPQREAASDDLRRLESLTAAIEAWRTALELDPTEARAMYNLAVAALKREGMATALPGFRRAGELDPSQDDFFFSLAGVYDDGTDAPDPNDVAPDRASRLNAAFALAFEEDFFSAADLIRLILDEDDDDAETLALAGYLYLKQEAVNEAMAVALRAFAISTRTPTAVYVLGAAFHKRPGLNRNAARVFDALAAELARQLAAAPPASPGKP